MTFPKVHVDGEIWNGAAVTDLEQRVAAQNGVANGVGTLDGTGKLTASQIPNTVVIVLSGNASGAPVQAITDPSGAYGTAILYGNAASFGFGGSGTPAGVYAPFAIHHKYGDFTNFTNANITKSTQAFFGQCEYFGPTTDDSAQGGNFGVYMKNTGTPYTQSKQVTGLEFDVQVEGNVTVSGPYALGFGTRMTVLSGGSVTNGYGAKVDAWTKNTQGATYGAMTVWRGYYDDLYNPAGSSFAANASVYGVNQIVSEQGFIVSRSGYGGTFSVQAQGNGGNPNTMLALQTPNPSTTTTVNDGVFASGSNLMTTATTPTVAWIGRVISNANVAAGTQVLSFYGSGPYTIVMTANASGNASAQTVTLAEPDLTALRINMASGQSTGNAVDVRDTAGTQRFVISRTGSARAIGTNWSVQNGSGQNTINLDPTGSLQIGNNVGGTGTTAARLWSGSGVPGTTSGTYPGNTSAPTAGDWYLRTDTPSTANQRLYICTIGGVTPTWVGVV